MTTKERSDSTPGPKPSELTHDVIQDLASRGAKWADIADYFGLSLRQVQRRKAEDNDLVTAYTRGRAELTIALNTGLLEIALLPIAEAAELKGGLNAKVRATEWAGKQFAGHSSETTVLVRDELGREDLAGVPTEDLERRLSVVRKLAEATEAVEQE